MVGFGSSLRIARRPGWERAYLDYETLKLLLSQIESVYEHHFEEQRSTRRTTTRRRGKRNKSTTRSPQDYRDELFLESDSDLAFASSDSDAFIRNDEGYKDAICESSDDEEEDDEDFYGSGGMGGGGGNGGMGGGGNASGVRANNNGDEEKHHHHHEHHGTTSTTNAFSSSLVTYSQDLSSSGEDGNGHDDDDDDYNDSLMSECAGGTISRAFSRRTKPNNSAIVSSSSSNNNNNNKQRPRNPLFKKPSATKRGSSGSGATTSTGNRPKTATEFFVGNNFILEQSSDSEHQHDLSSRWVEEQYHINHHLQQQHTYEHYHQQQRQGPQEDPSSRHQQHEQSTSSLLNASFFQAHNHDTIHQNEQTSLLPNTIMQPTFQEVRDERREGELGRGNDTHGEETMSSGFYNFPSSRDSNALTPPREYYPTSSSEQFYQNHQQQLLQQQQQQQQLWQQSNSFSGWTNIGTNVGTHRNSLHDQMSVTTSSSIGVRSHQSNTNKPTAAATTTTLLSKSEKRKLRKQRQRRRRQRQERRRQLAKKKQMMEERVPQHLRIAHSKARSITERFRGLLKAEVEKITLFAQARLGELADTAGSLRFVSLGEEEGFDRGVGVGATSTIDGSGMVGTMMGVGSMAPAASARREYDVLSDGGMHPSASSSDDERRQGGSADGGLLGGSFPWSDTSDDDTNSEIKERASSPPFDTGRDLRKSYSDGGFVSSGGAVASGAAAATSTSTTGSRQWLFSSARSAGGTDIGVANTVDDKDKNAKKGKSGRTSRRKGRHSQEKTSHQRIRDEEKCNAAKRQIMHFEQLRKNRPIFQRNDHIVGEDLLLLSAVDEADGYTAVGVELMHILHFIAVNVIAVRKICRKHDRLLANRMLGGYYHRKRMMQTKNKATGRVSTTRGLSQNPTTLGGIISQYVGDDDNGIQYIPDKNAGGGLNEDGQFDKLEGVFDAKIQHLANSTTIQVISSCLALALSEYEVSSSRADALARLNSTKTARISQTPLSSGSKNGSSSSRAGPFGLSPSRWFARGREPGIHEKEEYNSNERGRDASKWVKDQPMIYSDDELESGPPSSASSVSLTRLRFTVVSISALREAAKIQQNPLTNYLARSLLVVTGSTYEGLEGCSRSTLDFFVRFNPDTALILDSNELYHGLLEGQWRKDSIRNAMISALVTTISAAQLPPSRSHNTKYHHALPEDDGEFVQSALSMSLEKDQQLESLQSPVFRKDDQVGSSVQPRRISSVALHLNCFTSLLYTMNYYIIFPTASTFAKAAGAHPAYCATLIGATSFSAILSTSFHMYLLSSEYARKKWQQYVSISFFRAPLLLASFFPFLGNIVYALAVYQNSITLAVGGRLLVGLGSADIIHRQVISNCVPSVEIVPESARMVKAQFGGITAGLLLGALLGTFDFDAVIFGTAIYFPSYGASSIMAFLWFTNWIRLLLSFHEPNHRWCNVDESGHGEKGNSESNEVYINSDSSDGTPAATPGSVFYQSASDENHDELKATYGAISGLHKEGGQAVKSSIDHREIKHAHSKDPTQRRQGWKALLRRFLRLVTCNVALPVTIVLVLFIRVAHEILFASCAMLVHRYFDWSGNTAGLFLGCLSAVLLPVNNYCRNWSRRFEERTAIKQFLWFVCLGLCIMINWVSLFFLSSHVDSLLSESQHPYASGQHPYDWIFGVYQYVVGVTITAVSLFALEGTTLSLMSKVSPAQQDHSFIGCGTVVTLVGLFGRISGNFAVLMVSLSHRVINTDVVNSLVILLIGVCLAVRYLVKKHFFFLI